MSRIENALEKAARLRSSEVPSEKDPAITGSRERKIASTAGKVIPIDNPYLAAFCEPASPASEEYKKLKSAIIRMTKKDPQRRTILVTSAVGGEGKSITAANLALSLSQDYDHSVLLIDADLRRPALHHLFNVSPDSGLSDCIAEDRDIGSALLTLGNGNLSFLPSGKRKENPVELYSSQRMQRALRDMKYRYPDRYIIIDMPPVLLFAETKMFSSFVDGIIFVIKEGRAPMQHIVDALDALRGENMLGIVYNAVTPDGANGRSAYHSYYSDYVR